MTQTEANKLWEQAINRYRKKYDAHIEELKAQGIEFGLDGEDEILKGYLNELKAEIAKIKSLIEE